MTKVLKVNINRRTTFRIYDQVRDQIIKFKDHIEYQCKIMLNLNNSIQFIYK